MSTVPFARPTARPAGPRPMRSSGPVPLTGRAQTEPCQGLRARATQDTTAWTLVFDRLEANPYQLRTLRQVCRTFDALAGNNLRWLPYTPLAALGLGPPTYPLPEGCDVYEVSPGVWSTGGFEVNPLPFRSVNDALTYVQQHLATAAGTQVSAFYLPRLPSWLGAPEAAGWLRSCFQDRMAVAAEMGRCFGGVTMPQLMAEMWRSAPEPPPKLAWARMGDVTADLCVRVRAALTEHPGFFDLVRAAVDRPDLCEAPGMGTYALQAEPAIFATWLARHGTYGGVRAPAVTRDLEGFFRVAVNDSLALLNVHRDIGQRLDVCVWGVAHGGLQLGACARYFAPQWSGLEPFDWGASWPAAVAVDFAAHRAREAADSPIYRFAGGAELMREVTDWAAFEALAARAIQTPPATS